jgi:hypothetical protein
VRNLSVFDADLSVRSNIDVVDSRCFAEPRQLCSIRRYVSVPVCQLATSLVLTRLDFCNSVAFGLPAVHLRRLQAAQNAAARPIFSMRRTAHISDVLMCIHRLRVADRVWFKMAVLVYMSLHGSAPLNFTNTFTSLSSAGRRALRSSASHGSGSSVTHSILLLLLILLLFQFLVASCPLLATARFRSRAPLSRRACHPMLPHLLALIFTAPA